MGAKKKDNVKHITLIHEETKIIMKEPASRYQSPRTPYVILVDGEQKEVKPDEVLVFKSRDGLYTYHALWSDHSITVDTPAHRVQYDGRDMTVEDKHLVSSPTCGLCGDNNQDRRGDLRSALQCVHKSIQSMAQSFRIQDSECLSTISPTDQSSLLEEERLCAQSQLTQPQSSSPRRQENLRPVLKHLIVHHARPAAAEGCPVRLCPGEHSPGQGMVHGSPEQPADPRLASMEKSFESSVS